MGGGARWSALSARDRAGEEAHLDAAYGDADRLEVDPDADVLAAAEGLAREASLPPLREHLRFLVVEQLPVVRQHMHSIRRVRAAVTTESAGLDSRIQYLAAGSTHATCRGATMQSIVIVGSASRRWVKASTFALRSMLPT